MEKYITNDESTLNYKKYSLIELKYITDTILNSEYCNKDVENMVSNIYHVVKKEQRKLKIEQILNKNI
jgi:hypothetical protein